METFQWTNLGNLNIPSVQNFAEASKEDTTRDEIGHQDKSKGEGVFPINNIIRHYWRGRRRD